MGNVLHSICGPQLFNVLNSNPYVITNYSANILETLPNYIITAMRICTEIFKWTALIWMPLIYKRCKNLDGIMSMSKIVCVLIVGYWSLFVIRGFGRLMNPMYCDFLSVLQKAQRSSTTENMDFLNHYFFEFSGWPVTYDVVSNPGYHAFLERQHIFIVIRATALNTYQKRHSNVLFILKPLCYILAHTIGIRLAFPGCTSLINVIVANQRRERLIQLTNTYSIRRVKLKSVDRNDVEAFYKDNRNSGDPHGEILVICCEGNAGFAELGNPKIPLEKNYSVIGWNHPGFGGSTGLPFPDAEQNAIDAVMKFALYYLQFDVTQIIVFGWSIGGYTATWAAMHYPGIKSLILDATFDNIDKLAEKSLPLVLYPIVLATIHEYIDLDVVGQVNMYDGPVRFIIRGQDEIVTSEEGEKKSNRGYFLIVEVLKRRYPGLFSVTSLKSLWDFFGSTKYSASITLEKLLVPGYCESTLMTSLKVKDSQGPKYPLELPSNMTDLDKTKLLLYLASKYVDEINGAHCSDLPSNYFKEGWSEIDL